MAHIVTLNNGKKLLCLLLRMKVYGLIYLTIFVKKWAKNFIAI